MAHSLTRDTRAAYQLPSFVWIVLCASMMVNAQRRDTNDHAQPTTAEILVRAGDFVRDAAVQMRNLVADETSIQELFPPGFAESRPMGGVRQRRMRSEALFLWLAAADWMFVRNAISVDGRSVPDSGDRLDRLFKTPDIDSVAYIHKLQEENARFNLGSVIRTLGDPTFTLRFVDRDSRARFTFNRVGTERIGPVSAAVIAFKERKHPSVVRVDGHDALSFGTVWVDAADGTVMRTLLRLRKPNSNGIAASVTVHFQQDARLHLWVPYRMEEEYAASNGEMLIGSASYTNFRRFDTSVRVSAP